MVQVTHSLRDVDDANDAFAPSEWMVDAVRRGSTRFDAVRRGSTRFDAVRRDDTTYSSPAAVENDVLDSVGSDAVSPEGYSNRDTNAGST